MWDASRSVWLQVPSFPRARPRMYRREVWVAALSLIEAHSHTPLLNFESTEGQKSDRLPQFFLGGSTTRLLLWAPFSGSFVGFCRFQ